MTDRELLELAAKAAGYEFGVINDKPKIRRDGIGTCGTWGCAKHDLHDWNPLTDDGDAFRLVVRLKELGLWEAASQVEPKNIEGFWDGDACAATRRSIVRAAAEIGGRDA